MEDPNRLLRPILVLGMGSGGQDGAQVGARGGCSPGRTLGYIQPLALCCPQGDKVRVQHWAPRRTQGSMSPWLRGKTAGWGQLQAGIRGFHRC